MPTPEAAEARWLRPIARLSGVVGLGLCLAGCASGSLTDVLGRGPSESQPRTAPVAFAPIIGAPPPIAQKMTARLTVAAKDRNVTVVSGKGDKAAFTVRGYLVAAEEPRGTKISYIWDVTDAAGKRAQRLSGEEGVDSKGSDPWAGVDEATIERIAQKTASDLAAWLPKQSGPAVADVPATGSSGPTKVATAASGPTGDTLFAVPPVAGAPGDGKSSLTAAIRKRLSASGMKLASAGGRNVYTVKGNVSLTEAEAGKQSIRIEWQVVDPSGKRLGTVSQQNLIQQGSLDGPWGPVADAAANAAADGIIKLIPPKRG